MSLCVWRDLMAFFPMRLQMRHRGKSLFFLKSLRTDSSAVIRIEQLEIQTEFNSGQGLFF